MPLTMYIIYELRYGGYLLMIKMIDPGNLVVCCSVVENRYVRKSRFNDKKTKKKIVYLGSQKYIK